MNLAQMTRLRFGRCLFAMAVAAWAALGPAAATEVLDSGSKARINLASKLQMLSERVAAAACRAGAGVALPAAQQTLRDAEIEVGAILDALEHGNSGLGVPTAEARSRILTALTGVRTEWGLMAPAFADIFAARDLAVAGAKIVEQAATLRARSELLASEIKGFYSNPNEVLFADAIAIDFVGRQRVLAEQLAVEACQLAGGAPAAGANTLGDTMTLYENTLRALREGMPSVGVRPPPSAPVAERLAQNWEAWQRNKTLVKAVVETGDTKSLAALEAMAQDLAKGMNDLVVLYILSTPGRDGAIRGVLAEIATRDLAGWLREPALIAAIRAQNARHATLSQDVIDGLDQQWRAEAAAGGGPLITDVLARPLSQHLRARQIASAGFINEVFVMDRVGLNVGQSAVTSDYWQGDEAKWQETFGNGSGATHISDVEFDESTGVFQSQISLPVTDPETGALLGAVTFGVNVQSLL